MRNLDQIESESTTRAAIRERGMSSVTHICVSSQADLESVEKVRLRGSLCNLGASVVHVFISDFTTETQSITESTQRNAFSRQTP